MKRKLSCAIALAMLSGCSTQRVAPLIDDFASATSTAVDDVDSRFDEESLEQAYLEELHDAMVGDGKSYHLTGCNTELDPKSIDPEDERLGNFDLHCKIVPSRIILNAEDEIEYLDEPDFRPPDGGAGIDGYHARSAARALNAYAQQLAELANSQTPQELGMSFREAGDALDNLATSVQELNPDSPAISAKAQAMFQTGTGLIATLLSEAYEKKRYDMIADMVTRSDKLVETASRVIATWYFKRDKDAIREAYRTLEDSAEMANALLLAEEEGQQDGLNEVKSAYDALQETEENAGWRPYIGIARAHRAILRSLQEPVSLDELLAANERITALADQVKEFAEATRTEE